MLTIGLVTTSSTIATPAPQPPDQAIDTTARAYTQATSRNASMPDDGIYLYGESSQPGQIGKEYLVFEANQGNVLGAVYMPHSEYSCFYGTLDSKQMDLTVIDPYNQTALSHTISRQQHSPIAVVGERLSLDHRYSAITYPYKVGLEEYQPISSISDSDQEILRVCRDNYQGRVTE
ncbi:hypothetical protein [Moorena sp. SIO3I8]|uniref:hypothetical protein n=1 Tax=Moorena sp. SIO3I8 TaxID=2607833 RepID=UPI0026004346|nr:hypothetical protein [Moorena sp. SIO3I8]